MKVALLVFLKLFLELDFAAPGERGRIVWIVPLSLRFLDDLVLA